MKKNITIIILAISLVLSIGYIAYDKVYLESTSSNSINESNDELKEEQTNTDSTENNDINDTDKNITESNLLDLSQLSEYKNYTGTYGTLKKFAAEDYSISLSLDGKVIVCRKEACNNITNLESVIDMLELPVAEVSAGQQFYFLLDNGDVYNYKFGNIDNKIFTATKIETVSNVRKIINYSYGPKANAGGVWGIIAITEDNKYIQIAQETV